MTSGGISNTSSLANFYMVKMFLLVNEECCAGTEKMLDNRVFSFHGVVVGQYARCRPGNCNKASVIEILYYHWRIAFKC